MEWPTTMTVFGAGGLPVAWHSFALSRPLEQLDELKRLVSIKAIVEVGSVLIMKVRKRCFEH